MELSASETSVLTRATRRNIPEDGILHKRMFLYDILSSKYFSDINNLLRQLACPFLLLSIVYIC
jgi:hypothetical protein